MRISFVIALSVGIAVIVGLVLLAVILDQGLSERSGTASLMILGFVVFGMGGILFTGRAIWQWPAGQTPCYLLWERGCVIAAVLLNVWGLVLLEDMLSSADGPAIARLGMVTYGFGAVTVVVAETTNLSTREGKREWVYSQVVLYVVLAFLAQGAFGVALLQTELVAEWVGWAAIIWNLAWMVILPIFSPHNMYYPALHHFAPLIIGIALLAQG
jgi:hypothetical protein